MLGLVLAVATPLVMLCERDMTPGCYNYLAGFVQATAEHQTALMGIAKETGVDVRVVCLPATHDGIDSEGLRRRVVLALKTPGQRLPTSRIVFRALVEMYPCK
jgi:hypothetical protein